jgi:hypothetical protein
LFLAGVGIGTATNALPGFVASAVHESELAESLTGLEIMDTVATTVVLVAVGAVLSASTGTSGANAALVAVYIGLSVSALLAAIWISRTKTSWE